MEKEFKIEKDDDHLIVWRKTATTQRNTKRQSEWFKWQNIPAKSIVNFNKIEIKKKKEKKR